MAVTFLSSHGNVVVYLHGHPDARVREIADAVGITERAAYTIVSELVEEGYVLRERVGRRNRYTVITSRPLRHPAIARHTLGQLLRGLTRDDDDQTLVTRLN